MPQKRGNEEEAMLKAIGEMLPPSVQSIQFSDPNTGEVKASYQLQQASPKTREKQESTSIPTPAQKATPQTEVVAAPQDKWFGDYAEAYLSSQAHLFLFYGDVYGLHSTGKGNIEMLQNVYYTGQSQRGVVLTYECGEGFSFYDQQMNPNMLTMREKAKFLLETAGWKPATDPFGGGGDEDPFAGPMEPLDALRLIATLITAPEAKKQVAVFISRADLVIPANPDKGMMQTTDKAILDIVLGWARSKRIAQTQNPIILISKTLEDLHPDLRSADSSAYAIEIELPNRDERLEYIRAYRTKRASRGKSIPLLDMDEVDLANATAGLSRLHIQNMGLRGYKAGGIRRVDVTAYKNKMIEQEFGGIAQMLEPLKGGFASLGGMKTAKQWAMRDLIPLLRIQSEDTPKGVFLPGPPGGGKTYFVSALAEEVNLPAIALMPEKIKNMYVGNSERNLATFFRLVRAMAPCLVFIDEVSTTGFGQREGQGDPVASGLFGMLLKFMSDPSLYGKVVIFMADNRPDKIDPAMLRSGRFDVVMPILLPEEDERYEIALAQATTQKVAIDETLARYIAAQSDRLSSGDIFAIIKKAKNLAIRAGHPESLGMDEVKRALGYLRPNTKEIAELFTRYAVRACNDTEFLPEKYASWLEDRPALRAATRQGEKEIFSSYEREERASL